MKEFKLSADARNEHYRKDDKKLMDHVLLVVFLLVAVCLVVLIILQQGGSVDIGPSGSNVSSTLFSSSSSGNFVTRITAILAALFFSLSLILCNISSNFDQKNSTWNKLSQLQQADDKASFNVSTKLMNDIPQ